MIPLEKLSLGQGDVDILKKNAPTLIKQDRVACALGREGSFFFFLQLFDTSKCGEDTSNLFKNNI